MKSIQDDFCFKGMCQGKFEKKKGKNRKEKTRLANEKNVDMEATRNWKNKKDKVTKLFERIIVVLDKWK